VVATINGSTTTTAILSRKLTEELIKLYSLVTPVIRVASKIN
jgi:hypothetical protein